MLATPQAPLSPESQGVPKGRKSHNLTPGLLTADLGTVVLRTWGSPVASRWLVSESWLTQGMEESHFPSLAHLSRPTCRRSSMPLHAQEEQMARKYTMAFYIFLSLYFLYLLTRMLSATNVIWEEPGKCSHGHPEHHHSFPLYPALLPWVLPTPPPQPIPIIHLVSVKTTT